MSADVLDETTEDEAPPRKVYWAGSQWCVSDLGLETIRPDRYYLSPEQLGRLADSSDPEAPAVAEIVRHVCRKTWVDIEEFVAAYAIAVAVHDVQLAPGALAEAMRHVRAARFGDQAYDVAAKVDRSLGRGSTSGVYTGSEMGHLMETADAAIKTELARGRDFLEVRDPHLDFTDDAPERDDED
jgi:hypothetical protein